MEPVYVLARQVAQGCPAGRSFVNERNLEARVSSPLGFLDRTLRQAPSGLVYYFRGGLIE
jgi:hypothetical protein